MEILLVDDDSEVRTMLAELLETGGHRVTAVATARDALAMLDERPFDRLVSDLEMPAIDGEALIAAARLDHPRLVALLVSSHPEAAARARRLGVPLLAKPVEAATLLGAIEKATAPDLSAFGATPGPGQEVAPVAPPVLMAPRRGRRPTGPEMATTPRATLARRWAPGLAATALLLAVGWLSAPFIGRAPELPAPPLSGVVRGSGIDLLEPTGPLAAPPTRLRWRSGDTAVRHQVVFERVDGRAFFSQVVERQHDAAGDDGLDLPAELVASLEPMVVYFWWVEAFDAEGAVLARSPRQRFRILADATPSALGGSP